MNRSKIENAIRGRRLRPSHLLVGIATLYLFVVYFKFSPLFVTVSPLSNGESVREKEQDNVERSRSLLRSLYSENLHKKLGDNHHINEVLRVQTEADGSFSEKHSYGRGIIKEEIKRRMNVADKSSVLERMADEAWALGMKAWKEVGNVTAKERVVGSVWEGKPEVCPTGISITGAEFTAAGRLMFLPCGLAAGSSITVVGTPHVANARLSRRGYSRVLVSQFMVEFQGLKSVDREDPPKILHFNPRLKGDWNNRPVIEHNTCYRMQWGVAQRCDGYPSDGDDDMLVDGFRRCEKWIGSDTIDSKESKTTSWFKRFIGREQKPAVTWPFPFTEGKLFILTIRAGIDGYHMNIAGRHVTSFPYRVGFTLEDATGLAIKGNVEVHAVYATSLPTYHRSFSLKGVLEMLPKWKALPLLKRSIHLFVGVLSASNHFSERMAIRKTWMQSHEIKSSDVVVRFFVALNPRKEVNALLKEEASYFGDIVILPFMDRYELVVIKTIEICKYGVNIKAEFIMKCDDDNFVRVGTVLKEITGIPPGKALYMGNLNLLHRPLRTGKWAVNYEEWPEEVYPPYANGPGYIISSDIAKYVAQQHENKTLRVFKMEDVSMGVWVEEMNKTRGVQYSHSWKFCQYGCMEGYYTAHYQSPRQMVCLWDKLSSGHPSCCNFR